MGLPRRLEQDLNAALHTAAETGTPTPHDAIWIMAAPSDDSYLYAAHHQRCRPTVDQAESEESNSHECDDADEYGDCPCELPEPEQWWIDLPSDDDELRDGLIAWIQGAGDGYENMARANIVKARVEAGAQGPSPFQAWMKAVDAVFHGACGLTSRSLPDAPWRDWYDSDMGPHDAATQYAEDGWDDGLGLLGVLQEAGQVSP